MKIIGSRISFSDLSGIVFLYFQDHISICRDNSNVLAHGELIVLSSAQIDLTQNITWETIQEEKDGL